MYYSGSNISRNAKELLSCINLSNFSPDKIKKIMNKIRVPKRSADTSQIFLTHGISDKQLELLTASLRVCCFLLNFALGGCHYFWSFVRYSISKKYLKK